MLADRGLRGRYGAGGRALFEERYSIEKSAARMIDMYRRLVPATGSQTATCHVA
jgi:glycosyltransferase involved in cell wall biosynthesis